MEFEFGGKRDMGGGSGLSAIEGGIFAIFLEF